MLWSSYLPQCQDIFLEWNDLDELLVARAERQQRLGSPPGSLPCLAAIGRTDDRREPRGTDARETVGEVGVGTGADNRRVGRTATRYIGARGDLRFPVHCRPFHSAKANDQTLSPDHPSGKSSSSASATGLPSNQLTPSPSPVSNICDAYGR